VSVALLRLGEPVESFLNGFLIPGWNFVSARCLTQDENNCAAKERLHDRSSTPDVVHDWIFPMSGENHLADRMTNEEPISDA
jgi:hypothetical protein